jgi:hypothetical protein
LFNIASADNEGSGFRNGSKMPQYVLFTVYLGPSAGVMPKPLVCGSIGEASDYKLSHSHKSFSGVMEKSGQI